MSNWSQVKETMAASDRLNRALATLNERHVALVEGHGAEVLSALAARIEALVAATGPNEPLPFTVVAGKFEPDGTRNYKYIESFAILDEAQAALATVSSYPFAELESNVKCPGQGCQDQGCPAHYAG